MNTKPILVFFDGVDGAGKTTFINSLYMYLEKFKGIPVHAKVLMKTNDVSAMMRQVLIEEEMDDISRFMCQCFGSFRALNTLLKINDVPVILVDRSQASTFAYNIVASNISEPEKTYALHLFNQMDAKFRAAAGDHVMSVWVKTSPETARARIATQRGPLDVMESRPIEYQHAVANSYRIYYEKHKPDMIYDTEVDDQKQAIDNIATCIEARLMEHVLSK